MSQRTPPFPPNVKTCDSNNDVSFYPLLPLFTSRTWNSTKCRAISRPESLMRCTPASCRPARDPPAFIVCCVAVRMSVLVMMKEEEGTLQRADTQPPPSPIIAALLHSNETFLRLPCPFLFYGGTTTPGLGSLVQRCVVPP